MTFSEDCLEYFGTKDLYIILQLEKDKNLNNAKIKKAYYQQSILWHPDRFSSAQHNDADRDMATKKFQIIGKVYSILSDKQKRKIYDETGELDEEENLSDTNKDWINVWRGMFKKVTKEDIEEYLRKFRGSEDEMKDIKQAYLKHKGSMNKILASVVGIEIIDEDRVREIIRYFIEQGEVEAYTKFVNEPKSARMKRIKKAEKEAKEAEKMLKEMQKDHNEDGVGVGCSSSNDLSSLILAKQQKRRDNQGDFLAQLEEKYARPAKKSCKK